MNLNRPTRTLLVACVTIGCLSLAACGGDEGNNAREASAQTNNALPTAVETDSQGLPIPERRFFRNNSPWNTRIDAEPVDADSTRMIEQARERVGVLERDGELLPKLQRRVVTEGVYINTERWTTPVVSGGEPTSLVCRQKICGDGEANMVLDVPADIDPDPRYDGWFTIFDPSGDKAYDLWRARREADGTISYHFMREWDLNGPGYNPPNVVSARGSGLPLFAGLIRPRELEAGEINHALAISVPGPSQRWFVQPASSTDGNGRSSSLPEGARIRLKAGVVLPVPRDPRTGKKIHLSQSRRRLADAIMAALRTYGAIVVDRSAVPTLYAQRDVTRTLLRGNELQGLHLEDFEVIELPTKHRYPPEDDAGAITVDPTAAPTSGATEGNGG